MPFLPVYFYGTPGLRSDVFISYMRGAGYPVRPLSGDASELRIASDSAGAVVVIALQDSAEQVKRIIQRLDRQQRECIRRIFVLQNGKPFQSTDPMVRVVDCPSQLTQLVREIQALGREA